MVTVFSRELHDFLLAIIVSLIPFIGHPIEKLKVRVVCILQNNQQLCISD